MNSNLFNDMADVALLNEEERLVRLDEATEQLDKIDKYRKEEREKRLVSKKNTGFKRVSWDWIVCSKCCKSTESGLVRFYLSGRSSNPYEFFSERLIFLCAYCIEEINKTMENPL